MGAVEHRAVKPLKYPAVILGSLAVALCSLTGCHRWHHQAGTAQGEPLVGPFRAENANPFLFGSTDQPSRQEAVLLRIYRIRLTDLTAEQTEQLQALLKTALSLDNNAELLSRNGLLVSAGLADAWPKVLKVLGQGPPSSDPKEILAAGKRPKSQRVDTYLPEGLEAEIPVAPSAGRVDLFHSTADGQLLGKTYGSCQKLLVASGSPRPSGQVQVRMVPVLREQTTSLGVLLAQQQARAGRPQKYLARFEDLAVNVMVNPDEFLVIGPSGNSEEASFGRTFFQEKKPPQTDTIILLVVPRAVTYMPGEGFSQFKSRTNEP